jgi:NADH-quinone oxidoreductase subunit M
VCHQSIDPARYDGVAALQDIGRREFFMLVVLAVAVLLLGVWPQPLVELMDQSLGNLLIHVGQSKL